MSKRNVTSPAPPIQRKARKLEGSRQRKSREEAKRAPSSPRSTNELTEQDGMLVVDSAGKVDPLDHHFARRWKVPETGNTIPINQRFARMWKIPQNIVERLIKENALRNALARQEFVVHYQPLADVDTSQIVGMEALVRWQHPDRGLVWPDEFIPLAEETGLIVSLGEWVLRGASAQNKSWQNAGLPPLRMAVNLSARQFKEPSLVQSIANMLKETSLDPRWLELEITEGIAMQNADFTIGILRDLVEMGIRISIDDFGSGYSSLGYLNRFPIHSLKIDRSFIAGVTHDKKDAAIVSAIIAMAHSLSLEVVAEGVQTEDQLAFLRERHCDRVQGFLVGRPMPAELIRTTLEQRADFRQLA